jgi:hypothetical protein
MSYSSQISLIFTNIKGTPPAVFVRAWGGEFQIDNENRATWTDTLIEQSTPVPSFPNPIAFALQSGPGAPAPFGLIALSVHLNVPAIGSGSTMPGLGSGPLFRSGYMSELPPPAPASPDGVISIVEVDSMPGPAGPVPITLTQAQVNQLLAQNIPLPYTPPGHPHVLVIDLSATLMNPTAALPAGSISLAASGTATLPLMGPESLTWTYSASVVLAPSMQQYPSTAEIIDVGIADASFSVTDPNGPDPVSGFDTALLNGVLNEFATEQVSSTFLQMLTQQVNNAVLAFAVANLGLPAGSTSLPFGVVLSMRQVLVTTMTVTQTAPEIFLIPAIGCFGSLTNRPPPPPPNLGNIIGWSGDFTDSGKSEVLAYLPSDQNWWLGIITGTSIGVTSAAITTGFGNTQADPTWIGDFTGSGRSQLLFYAYGSAENPQAAWWLGTFHGDSLSFQLAANTVGFGDTGGFPTWIGDFTGTGKSQVLFFAYGSARDPQAAWWLGTFEGDSLSFQLAANTVGFGDTGGFPTWIGDFTGTGKSQVLFFAYGSARDPQAAWWLGTFEGNSLSFQLAANTVGFGDTGGFPTWIGDFTGTGKSQVLFFAYGNPRDPQAAWWLGTFEGNSLSFQLAATTVGFGDTGGFPTWIGDFTGSGKSEVLFYEAYVQSGWVLGTFTGTQLSLAVVT